MMRRVFLLVFFLTAIVGIWIGRWSIDSVRGDSSGPAADLVLAVGREPVMPNVTRCLAFRFSNSGDASLLIRAFDEPNQRGSTILDFTLGPKSTVEIGERDSVAHSFFFEAQGAAGAVARLVARPLLRNTDSKASYWARSGDQIYSANRENVGIGTTSPTCKLDVNGAIAVSGQKVIDASGRFLGSPVDLVGLNPKRVALLRWYEVRREVSFSVGAGPRGVAFDGANIWVANQAENTVSKIQAHDGKVLGTFAVGSNPRGLAFDGANIWVTNFDSNTVTKLEASTGNILGTPFSGSTPDAIVFDGVNVWVTNSADGTVSKIRCSDEQLLETICVGTTPSGIAFDGTRVWVTNLNSNTLTRIRVSDSAVDTIPAQDDPLGIAFDGVDMWVVHGNSGCPGSVTRFRGSDGTILGEWPLGLNATGIVFDGANVWVANENAVSKLRVKDGVFLGTFPTGDSPFGMAFDGANIWVSNAGDATVSKL